MDPLARSAAATLDHSDWCANLLPTETFLERTKERMAELRELHADHERLQKIEEEILHVRAGNILADLSEALCEYVADRPKGASESATGAERRATLQEAARLLGHAVKSNPVPACEHGK